MENSIVASPQLAVVVWEDAWADGGDSVTTLDAHEKHRATIMQTLGWLLADDDAGVSLFNERCLDKGEETYRSRTFIPRALIRSVTPMNLTAPRKPKKPIDTLT